MHVLVGMNYSPCSCYSVNHMKETAKLYMFLYKMMYKNGMVVNIVLYNNVTFHCWLWLEISL